MYRRRYVEMAFFERWWAEQTPTMREAVRGLVSEGRLAFANAGWCMHDEAAAHYVDMIDNTAIGHRFLYAEVGAAAIPTAQWSIDPFGHSGGERAVWPTAPTWRTAPRGGR